MALQTHIDSLPYVQIFLINESKNVWKPFLDNSSKWWTNLTFPFLWLIIIYKKYLKKRCVQKVENVWIYTSVHKAFITLFTFTRGKGLPFFMLDTFNVSAFSIISLDFSFFLLRFIIYRHKMTVCVCAVVEYRITIAESNLWPPPPPSPSYLSLFYDKKSRNICIRTIWNVEFCWIDTVSFYGLCFKKLGDICDENISAKVKNLETGRHIYIFAMQIVSPAVLVKS